MFGRQLIRRTHSSKQAVPWDLKGKHVGLHGDGMRCQEILEISCTQSRVGSARATAGCSHYPQRRQKVFISFATRRMDVQSRSNRRWGTELTKTSLSRRFGKPQAIIREGAIASGEAAIILANHRDGASISGVAWLDKDWWPTSFSAEHRPPHHAPSKIP